jgi:hypothetical protein
MDMGVAGGTVGVGPAVAVGPGGVAVGGFPAADAALGPFTIKLPITINTTSKNNPFLNMLSPC